MNIIFKSLMRILALCVIVISVGCNGSGGGDDTTGDDSSNKTGDASLPSSVAGQVITMEFGSAQTGALYNNNDQVLFTFSSSGSLMLTNQSTVVATSFEERGSEYIWVDSSNSVEYALSLLNDQIHEVNLTGLSGTPFYGQFTPVTSNNSGGSSGGTATNPGATLADLNGKNGAILSLPGGTHKWYLRHKAKYKFDGDTDSYRHVSFTLYSEDGIALLDTTTESSAAPYTISFYAPTTLGSNNCDTNTKMNLSIGGGSVNGSYTATACTIEMDYISKLGALEGTIKSADFTHSSDSSTLSLKDIPFRIYKHKGTSGSVSTLPDSVFATMNVGSVGTAEIGPNQYFELDNPTTAGVNSSTQIGGVSPDDGTESFTGNASDRIVLVGQYIKGFNVGSTISCATGYQKPTLFVYMGTYQQYLIYKTSTAGGSCTIEKVTDVNGFFTANYSATLLNADTLASGTKQIDISGQFKNYAIRPISADNGDEGALATGEFGVSFKITEGSGHFIQNHQFKNVDDQWTEITKGSTNFSIYTDQSEKAVSTGMSIREIPITVGNYSCGTAFTSSVAANVRMDTGMGMTYNAVNTSYDRNTTTYSHSVISGASCTINVTAADTTKVEGNFTATLLVEGAETIMPNSDNTISLTGTFRKKIAQ